MDDMSVKVWEDDSKRSVNGEWCMKGRNVNEENVPDMQRLESVFCRYFGCKQIQTYK